MITKLINNRIIIVIFIVLLLLLLSLFISNIFLNKYYVLNKINKMSIDLIELQNGVDGKPIIFRSRNEIEDIKELLDFEAWERISTWEYPHFPSVFAIIHSSKKEYVLGFLQINDQAYCNVKSQKINIYYRIPNEVYNKVRLHTKRVDWT